MTGVEIHPSAIIESGAELGPGCKVGPYSIIRSNVRMGARNQIGPHVVIEGNTTLGDENTIFQFASIGAAPQDLKFKGEPSELRIGDKNLIREYVTLQPGTEGGGMLTKIGSANLFMCGSHVGHDAIIGDHNVFANHMSLAGHVVVGNRATLGGMCGIHQFVRLGDLCILGAGSMVSKDIPPFCTAHGDHAELVGLNSIGLERAGVTTEQRARLKRLYKETLYGTGKLSDRITELRKSCLDFELGLQFLDFFGSSSRGVAFPRKKLLHESD